LINLSTNPAGVVNSDRETQKSGNSGPRNPKIWRKSGNPGPEIQFWRALRSEF